MVACCAAVGLEDERKQMGCSSRLAWASMHRIVTAGPLPRDYGCRLVVHYPVAEAAVAGIGCRNRSAVAHKDCLNCQKRCVVAELSVVAASNLAVAAGTDRTLSAGVESYSESQLTGFGYQ